MLQPSVHTCLIETFRELYSSSIVFATAVHSVLDAYRNQRVRQVSHVFIFRGALEGGGTTVGGERTTYAWFL